MPWDADLQKEGHGELCVLTEDEAFQLEKRGIPILTGLQTMDLEQSSLNRILNGGVCELFGIDRNGRRVLIGAKPDDLERGFFFDEDFSGAVETCLDIGSQALDCNGSGKNTFCKIGRQQTAKTVEVDAMLREAPDALEHVRVHPAHGIDMPQGDPCLLGGKAQGHAALLRLLGIVGLGGQLIPRGSNQVASLYSAEPLTDRKFWDMGGVDFRGPSQSVELGLDLKES